MTTFWKNLHGLAHGQLFNGGYLAPSTAAALAAVKKSADSKCNAGDCRQRSPWPRLAAYR